jgi:hypothetical protein
MSSVKIVRPRNDFVVVQQEVQEQVGGIALPQSSQEGKRFVVKGVGPKVQDLDIEDVVVLKGVEHVDWAFVPGCGELIAIKEQNVVAVISHQLIADSPQDAYEQLHREDFHA